MVEISQVSEEPETVLSPVNNVTTTKGIKQGAWIDLMGKDLTMKVVNSENPANGKGPEAIKPHDTVLIDFIGRIAPDQSTLDGPVFQVVKGWLVVVGEGDVLPSIEMATRFMETGQKAHVWSHSKYAFGPGTRSFENTTVPPNTNVLFELTVSQIVMDTSRLNPYFTIQKNLTRKNIANDIYKCEWCTPPKRPNDPICDGAMARAIRLYQKAAKEMDTLLNGTYFQQVEKDHPQRQQSKQLMFDSLNNVVAVFLKQEQYHKAKQAAIEVLKHDNKNLKALLRAAKAALMDQASTMEEVEAAIHAAELEITYKNPQEEKELHRLKALFKRKKSEYKQKTKEMFSNKLQNQKKEKAAENLKANKKDPDGNAPIDPPIALEQKNANAVKFEDSKKVEQIKDNLGSQGTKMLLWGWLPLVLYFIFAYLGKEGTDRNE